MTYTEFTSCSLLPLLGSYSRMWIREWRESDKQRDTRPLALPPSRKQPRSLMRGNPGWQQSGSYLVKGRRRRMLYLRCLYRGWIGGVMSKVGFSRNRSWDGVCVGDPHRGKGRKQGWAAVAQARSLQGIRGAPKIPSPSPSLDVDHPGKGVPVVREALGSRGQPWRGIWCTRLLVGPQRSPWQTPGKHRDELQGFYQPPAKSTGRMLSYGSEEFSMGGSTE